MSTKHMSKAEHPRPRSCNSTLNDSELQTPMVLLYSFVDYHHVCRVGWKGQHSKEEGMEFYLMK